jgi:hypothetical protein
VKEHCRHLAACVPDFGEEWTIIANNFLKLHAETTEGLGLTWGHRTLGLEGDIRELSRTRNVFIFTDKLAIPKATIVSGFRARRLKATVIDDIWWQGMIEAQKPDAFLCHDARDAEFVQRLFEGLCRCGLNVWYSGASMSVGDNVASVIDRGLTECTCAILVVSKNLLQNTGWANSEMSAILNRQSDVGGVKHLLPVWLDVEKRDVAARSTLLANRFALKSSLGFSVLAEKLTVEVNKAKHGSS